MTPAKNDSRSVPADPLVNCMPPHPTSPLSGQVVSGSAITFEWKGVPEATEYLLQIAVDRQFVRDIRELRARDSLSIVLHDPLPAAAMPYFWRVRAVTSSGETRWSPYGRFFVGSDAQVEPYWLEEEDQAQRRRRDEAPKRAIDEASRKSDLTASRSCSASPPVTPTQEPAGPMR